MPSQVVTTETVRKVGFDQNLGAQVPLDLAFRDESGRAVRLGDYFGKAGRDPDSGLLRVPDALHDRVLNGLLRSLKRARRSTSGKEFDIVTVSIDPRETAEAGRGQEGATYLERYDRPGAERGWHFLTGDEPRSTGWPRRSGSATPTTPRATSTPTRPGSWS